jgi:peptidoglycan/xylan/chitin deacetylase (PgdA/CDA1 family)
VGAQIEKYPELARRITGQGHTIGNHTQTHPSTRFWRASPRQIASEIDRCVAALLLADAPFEHFFRPPVGVRNPFLAPQLSARGLDLVLWNARGFDGGGRDPQAALARIAREIRPGSILVSHEGGIRTQQRLIFLELLLEHLQQEDYVCVLPKREAFCF